MKELTDSIAENLKKWEAARAWYFEHAGLLNPLAEEVIRLGGEASISEYPWFSLRLSGDKHALAEIVRKLRTTGFSTTEAPPAANASSWSPFFYHSGIKEGMVYLSFSSTVCRRVKVGTRVVPERVEDVYETVCGEIELDYQTQQCSPKSVEVPF